MEYAVLGWPPDGPKLRLDHEQFSYAGKFVMTNTGKAVARERVDGEDRLVAAVAFNEDRTDADALWLRYITVHKDNRGEGIGPRLARFVAVRARDRGYDTVKIGVNNPFAFEALYRAGFGYTGEQTGVAELVLAFPSARSPDAYRAGLDVYRERDLSDAEETFLAERTESTPPRVVDVPQ
ncbi:GNAT family N-acetyltransferase [Halorientalis brevis]|uniref:GNAT family N-acetyltransferase n=1 Tax=Halorientalis brevis TaxID=1126241 RepID=A0ABD6CB71_9EURY|nr:GNAT family N-acetyltransferase [Halorientalis brevis]